MKKLLSFTLISAIILSLTACNTYAPEKFHEETITETTASLAVTTTPIVTTIAETVSTPAKLSEYINENGLLTAEGMAQIDRIFKEKSKDTEGCYCALGLFDFDRDGVPEINIVKHNGGQGEMPIDIFTMDGEPLGSFQGYCRDGFCRMSYGENCVYVHNSYEHSAHQKVDDVQKLTFED